MVTSLITEDPNIRRGFAQLGAIVNAGLSSKGTRNPQMQMRFQKIGKAGGRMQIGGFKYSPMASPDVVPKPVPSGLGVGAPDALMRVIEK